MEKTILVVEDDRGLNQGVAMALKNPQYHFLLAYTSVSYTHLTLPTILLV